MPVIVVGADTDLGRAIVPALRPASGEIRLFASDAEAVAGYRSFAKVAVGDVSDGTHVGGAAFGAFCAIVIAAAAQDDRERGFAANPADVFAQWVEGLGDARVARIILVGSTDEIPEPTGLEGLDAQFIRVDTRDKNVDAVAAEVVAAEAAR